MPAQFEAAITFLPTQDLERVTSFFLELLGSRLVLHQGTCRIFELSPGGYYGFCKRDLAMESPRDVIITLVTNDVDGWYWHLRECGVVPEAPPKNNAAFGIYHFFFPSPDGYRVEIQRFETNWRGD